MDENGISSVPVLECVREHNRLYQKGFGRERKSCLWV